MFVSPSIHSSGMIFSSDTLPPQYQINSVNIMIIMALTQTRHHDVANIFCSSKSVSSYSLIIKSADLQSL